MIFVLFLFLFFSLFLFYVFHRFCFMFFIFFVFICFGVVFVLNLFLFFFYFFYFWISHYTVRIFFYIRIFLYTVGFHTIRFGFFSILSDFALYGFSLTPYTHLNNILYTTYTQSSISVEHSVYSICTDINPLFRKISNMRSLNYILYKNSLFIVWPHHIRSF